MGKCCDVGSIRLGYICNTIALEDRPQTEHKSIACLDVENTSNPTNDALPLAVDMYDLEPNVLQVLKGAISMTIIPQCLYPSTPLLWKASRIQCSRSTKLYTFSIQDAEIHTQTDPTARVISRYKAMLAMHHALDITQSTSCKCEMQFIERLAMPSTLLSIILTQPLPRKIRHRTRTIEIPIPSLRRQNAIRHARLPIPLRRRFRRPGPIEPPPSAFVT